MIQIKSIGSSSSGNMNIIKIDDICFLIDLGLRYKQLKENINTEEIQAVFITHSHYDHISAFPVVCKHLDVPYYASKRTRDRMKSKQIKGLEYYTQYEILPGFHVTMLQTDHDCPGSAAFVFSYHNHILTYLTDLGHVDEQIYETIKDSDTLIIEANHNKEMLINGPYPYDLKRRILSEHGHLSNDDCAILCKQMIQNKTRNIILAHLSLENNRPELAYKELDITDPHINIHILKEKDSPLIICE